ncbi:hypothetical protein [Streptomyces sp. NPDC051561]|uniref:hypothetical protein n=1 Tax=Streptomyces sp. NPDC051561 TaxID=3365658 RepID=UPI0037B72510
MDFPPGREGCADERGLQRYVRQQLQVLDVHPPLDVAVLCKALSTHRERHIELREFPLRTPGPQGLRAELETADLIVFQSETTKLHQDHIILHEVGHILADHPGIDPAKLKGVMAPDGRLDSAQPTLHRDMYDTAQELEAEMVATIILEWASVLDAVMPVSVEDPAARRVQAALGDHLGWM